MSSILQTDVVELYNSWGERVAFNEGYQAQKIASAKQAGRDAFNLGLDSGQGKDLYFASVDQRFMEAKEFLSGESAVQIESIEPDQIGDITDGEETLGMESCVADETEESNSWDGLTDSEWSAKMEEKHGSLHDEMMQDKWEETMYMFSQDSLT